MAKESLLYYLRNRLLLLGLVLTILFSAVMVTVYNWGLDDASEYYLLQDARYAESLLLRQSPWPNNSFEKQFYLGFDSLPNKYMPSLKSDTYLGGGPIQYFAMGMADDFFYGVRYRIEMPKDGVINLSGKENAEEEYLYVVHGFHLIEDEGLPGLSMFEVSVIILLIVLFIMVLGALLIYSSVSKAMQALQIFSNQQQLNPTSKFERGDDDRLLLDMRYIEVQEVAGKLKEALQCINGQAQKERAFIQSLSHELRTPMAITGVALDLLSKQLFDVKVQQKLQKIRQANNNMIALANTLLGIWNNEKEHKFETLDILPFVAEVTADLMHLSLRDDVHFELDIPQALTMNICLLHFKIILENLCKNALQYGAGGAISIKFDKNSMTVGNDILNAEGMAEKNEQRALTEKYPQLDYGYGYGLGLYIAQQAALKQGWELIINGGADNEQRFMVELIFNPLG